MSRSDGAVQVYRYDAVTGSLLRVSIGGGGFDDDGNGGVGNAMTSQAHQGICVLVRRGRIRRCRMMGRVCSL